MGDQENGDGEKLYPVLEQIAKYTKKYEDFAAFNSVCTTWRAASRVENFRGLPLAQEIPHLMISAKEEDVYREFYSLMEGKVVAKLNLPKIRGKICFESLGWFVTISPQREMSLMNPFTGAEIKLPGQMDFPDFPWVKTEPKEFIKKVVLSSRPSQKSNFIVIVIYGTVGCLGFWRPDLKKWEMLRPAEDDYCYRSTFQINQQMQIKNEGFHDLTSCNDNLFAIDSNGNIWSWNLSDLNQVMFLTKLPDYGVKTQYYMVESFGKLLVIACRRTKENVTDWNEMNNRLWDRVPFLEIFQVDIHSRIWTKVEDLDGRALFIGYSASLLIDASKARKIKANHIYYAGVPRLLDRGTWIYNLKNGNLELFEQDNLISSMCPPIWIAPYF